MGGQCRLIHARTMGNYIDERLPRRVTEVDTCPICGGIKSKAADHCVACNGRARETEDDLIPPEAIDAVIGDGWSCSESGSPRTSCEKRSSG